MITPRGYAIALKCALAPDELATLAARLSAAAADLAIRAEEEIVTGKRKILARRADCIGALAEAIQAELAKSEMPA